jgi:raffinose/stachyose/melibiose transport system permease protein
MKLKKLPVWLFVSLLFVTQIYPLLWLLLYSLKTNKEILSGSFLALPKALQWVNYQNALVNGNYPRYLLNSLIVTGVTLFLTLLLSSMVAYAIARFEWRWSKWAMLVFLIGLMIPTQSTLLPLVVLFKKLHILDSYLSLILPYVSFSIPMAVFILVGYFKTITRELEESASIDGASTYRTFRSVILPISVPSIVTVTILTFISVWNEYIMAATFISSSSLKTIPFGVYSYVGKYTTNYGAVGAYLVLGALPVLLIYFVLAEKITAGMVAGAVKG